MRFMSFTIPIVLLMIASSSIGIFYQKIYERETIDWFSQTIGQDFSNVFVMVPVLVLSAFFASKGYRAGQIIWAGFMITNVYAFVIYSFALHFNFLFHVYCAILGLSIYSVLYFSVKYLTTDFRSWFTDQLPVKAIAIFLIVTASLFTLLWLSQSLPAALVNQAPESVEKAGLLVNPVQVLDFSFYLPLMFLSGFMLLKKKSLGYLLASIMIVFALMTTVNIISLMIASMKFTASNNWEPLIVFGIFTVICFYFFLQMLRHLKK